MVTVADLRAAPSLVHASDEGLARLAAQSAFRRFDRGEFLFRASEPVSRIFLIGSGRVAAVVTSRVGTMLMFHVAGERELAGNVSVFEPGHLASAKALSRVEAIAIPAKDYLELLGAESAVALDLARELAGIVRVLNESLADLVFLDLERRLARSLLEAPPGGDLVHLIESQSDLGARLGATRQSVNQALGRLVRRGLVRIDGPRVVRILDREAIGAFIDGLDEMY
ncbi:Crp/Fnr family transcriptional regulator [Micropruina sp.]|uniref:Crp/Fnr family transcriptional regulator n=1 Tax=Micropruina sp. TaxID=2737536 RepID=UPI00262FEC9D|nr:Crp/Fnr family transcriptional regulator [Micropruina sp.]